MPATAPDSSSRDSGGPSPLFQPECALESRDLPEAYQEIKELGDQSSWGEEWSVCQSRVCHLSFHCMSYRIMFCVSVGTVGKVLCRSKLSSLEGSCQRSSHTAAVLSFALFHLGNHSFFPLRIIESAKDTGTAVFSHQDFSCVLWRVLYI